MLHFREKWTMILKYELHLSHSTREHHITTAAQVVRMIVELHPLVCTSFASSRLDHRPCLCRLRRVVVTAKAFAIEIVGIVLTIVWQIECLVIVLDGLQLLIVLILVIDSHTISLISCVWDSPWVCLIVYG